MSKIKQISGYKIALCFGQQTTPTSMVALVLFQLTGHGAFDTVAPCLIKSRQNQKQRVNKLPALMNVYAPDSSVIGLTELMNTKQTLKAVKKGIVNRHS